MKLDDIINTELSLYNALGKYGGTALPDNDSSVEVNGIQVWKKSPPFRVKGKRIDEEQAHAEYAPEFAKFGNPEPSKKRAGVRNENGAKVGDVSMTGGKGVPTRKEVVRKVGKNAVETVDDEGNHRLRKTDGKAVTGKIDYKKANGENSSGTSIGLNKAAMSFHESIKSILGERNTGVGHGASLGGSGATEHPMSGPSELEYDLTKVEDEFKGKDTRADIKKSKDKRLTLKKFLQGRTDREVERVTAAGV
jgi:hypothetical protein